MAEVRRFAHGSRVPGWDEPVDLELDPAEVPDPATTPVPEELRTTIEAYMARYPDRRSAVIPALAAAQQRHGWCSPEAVDQVACVMRLTPGYVASVATFYDMLEVDRKTGHDVYVCTNISCGIRGGDEMHEALVRAAGEEPDFNVREFECLGACDLAPMASVDGVYIGPLTPADAPQIVDDVRAGRPVLKDRQLRFRLGADADANSRPFPVPGGAGERARAKGVVDQPDVEAASAGRSMRGDVGGEAPAPDHGEHHPPQTEKRQGP